MNQVVKTFIIALFEAYITKGCISCGGDWYKVTTLREIGGYRRVHMGDVKLKALVQALLHTGLSLDEVRSLLKVPVPHPKWNTLGPPYTDEQVVDGQWVPTTCVMIEDLVDEVRKRYPDSVT